MESVELTAGPPWNIPHGTMISGKEVMDGGTRFFAACGLLSMLVVIKWALILLIGISALLTGRVLKINEGGFFSLIVTFWLYSSTEFIDSIRMMMK